MSGWAMPVAVAAVANHLWQSTLFAWAMWGLARALRRNSASVRYAVWMAASVKFLVPFALLVSVSAHFAWRATPKIVAAPAAQMMVEMEQPFAASEMVVEPAMESVSAAPVAPAEPVRVPLRERVKTWLPEMLLAVWLCGVLVGVGFWVRWMLRMRQLRRAGTVVEMGLPLTVMTSSGQMEPCVFGLWRPVLMLPEGIEQRLTAEEMAAVMEHELSHVRRRDHVTSAMHVLVETVFWFWPVLRWVRVRLLEERERACDEAVLRAGSEPRAYAEGILKVCRLYLMAEPMVAAGVSGAQLRERIEAIVSGREVMRMSWAKKVLLAAVIVMVVGVPVVMGQAEASMRVKMLAAMQVPRLLMSPVREATGEAEVQTVEQPKADAPAVDAVTIGWQRLQQGGQDLDGKEVSVPGFMVPLEDGAQRANRFLLVPYAGSCIHVPPPPANQMIDVAMERQASVPVDIERPVIVTGRLETSISGGRIKDAAYGMVGMSVRMYDPGAAETTGGSGEVMVAGAARRPGGYLIGPQSTLLNVIKVAGGPTRLSDMRDVQLKRGGKTVAHLDLYSLLDGGKHADTKLQPGDVVNFPAAKAPGAKDEQVLVMFDPGAAGEETPYGRVYSMMTEGLKGAELAEPRPAAFVEAQFPSDASGMCTVDVIVDSKGAAHVVGVRSHSSDLEFDARWIQAVEKTAWKPATLDGRVVGSKMMMAIGARLLGIGVAPQGGMAVNTHDLSGTWQGTIASQANFRVALKVERSGSGWSGLLYRPGVPGTMAVEIPAITLTVDTVRFEIPSTGNRFEGRLNADDSSLVGNWTGGEKPELLTLTKATVETAWDTPAVQLAVKPMVSRDPSFDVATIKPALPQAQFGRPSVSWNGRKLNGRATTAKYLLEFAYGVNDKQVVNMPEWMDKDKYDIAASVAEGEGTPNVEQWKVMLRKLLAERFGVQFHRETRELAAFALMVAKGGPKLTASSTAGTFMAPGMGFALRPNGLQALGSNLTMADFAVVLSRNVLERPVVDRTGLTGHYDIQFLFASQPGQMAGWQGPPVNGEPAEDVFSALQNQLGLKLDAVKAPVEVMVLDKAVMPTAN